MDSSKCTTAESTPVKRDDTKGQKMQHGMMALIRVNPSQQTYEIIECEDEKKKCTLSECSASPVESLIEDEQNMQNQMLTVSGEDSECEQIWEIQDELNTLDSFFRAHVTALKKQIETACQEFTLAQKKYKTLEKEYVNAKVEFLQKLEQKEQLQENLHTVIQQYEAHRAVKLHELEQRLRKFILSRDGKIKQEKQNLLNERNFNKVNNIHENIDKKQLSQSDDGSNHIKNENDASPKEQV
ncbi:uncharacterized protein LOC111625854 [Centruroides sculpturatus]|uniref:uncharacterized protein LOC111625854 n=1 Tax=Centruroides sculpturatus TaxID=218467 RepID=UPI000C6E155C|nr:uncharacterized protein LOC111625854 [Centruroides sculpturatus]